MLNPSRRSLRGRGGKRAERPSPGLEDGLVLGCPWGCFLDPSPAVGKGSGREYELWRKEELAEKYLSSRHTQSSEQRAGWETSWRKCLVPLHRHLNPEDKSPSGCCCGWNKPSPGVAVDQAQPMPPSLETQWQLCSHSCPPRPSSWLSMG